MTASFMKFGPFAGGQQEYEAVRDFAQQAHPAEMYACEQRILNRPSAPVLVLFWKKMGSQ